MTESCRLLFVYGTLRQDSPHPMAKFLASQARFVGRGSMPGQLYDLGPFPGMVAAQAQGERVHGHLFEMHDPENLLIKLDEYEAVPQGLPEPPQFERQIGLALAEGGDEVRAWVYRYAGPLGAARRVWSGHYISS